MPKLKLKRSVRPPGSPEPLSPRVENAKSQYKRWDDMSPDEFDNEFELMGPEAFAATWVSVHDEPPNLPGDGAAFRMYASKTRHTDSQWLQRFMLVIQRTMLKVNARFPAPTHGPFKADLQRLFNYVQTQVTAALQAEIQADIEEAGGEIEFRGAEAYAAQWGCESVYDTPPNLPGDGGYFYNYGSEHQERTFQWLERFCAAIQRTILKAQHCEDSTPEERTINVRELTKLYGIVRAQADLALLAEVQRVGP